MKVLIGVDPHKASVAVAAVEEVVGELLELASFPQDRAGLRALERWAKRFPERRWAMENARGLGRHLAGRLVAAGECVVDVPPKLSARVRVLSTGNARKNDGLDALATALAASRKERLAPVDPEADSEVLRLLSERRVDLVAERTRALNRLHGLLRDLLPGGVAGKLSADRAARILRSIRARGCASDRLRRRLASEILRDVGTLDRKIADLGGRIEAEVEASGTRPSVPCLAEIPSCFFRAGHAAVGRGNEGANCYRDLLLLERRLGEVLRIYLPRTPVNRGRPFTGAGYTYFIKNDAIYLVLVLS